MKTDINQIVANYPNKDWDANLLSSNQSIRYDTVIDVPSIRWNATALSSNSTIDAKTVINNPSFNWNYRALCSNQTIGFDFLIQYVVDRQFSKFADWTRLSANNSVQLNHFRMYKNKPWNFEAASANTNITSNFVLVEYQTERWDIKLISSNPGISQDDIFKNRMQWDYNNLSSNINLPIQYVVDNSQRNWNWMAISANPGTTVMDLIDHPNAPWDTTGLAINPNVTWDYISNNWNRGWNWSMLLKHPALTVSRVDDIRDEIPLERSEIVAHMSANPNIDETWIEDNIRHINWTRMSGNRLRAI